MIKGKKWMKLTDREWKSFYIKDIFSAMQRGKRLIKENQLEGGKPYVSSTAINNGVDNYIGNTNGVREYSDCLTIANSGSVGETFYHPYEFVASDHVTTLTGKYSKEVYKFLAGEVKRIQGKYHFNREISDERLSKERIMLPISEDGRPDWDFMEKYIKVVELQKYKEYSKYAETVLNNIIYIDIPDLSEKEWGGFKINELCHIKSGIDIYHDERTAGDVPYVTSTALNNGIKFFVGNTNNTLGDNTISVNRNGAVGYAFYHKYEALFSNDCRRLELKERMNEFTALFVTSQIMSQKEKYSYGYKMGTGRLENQEILIPVDSEGKPDYDYMEQYIKNLMVRKYKEYLEFKS